MKSKAKRSEICNLKTLTYVKTIDQILFSVFGKIVLTIFMFLKFDVGVTPKYYII